MLLEHGIKHERSQGLVDYAYSYAKAAHGEQKRKYTGEPYINHPVEVANIVASVTDDVEMICAALLHDVLEDTSTNYIHIKENFGLRIARYVNQLTDVSRPEDGNRAVRKRKDRAHLSMAEPQAKTVKLADLISNTSSIVEHDANFAKVYMAEKAALLEVLTEGDRSLLLKAASLVDGYNHELLDPSIRALLRGKDNGKI